MTYSKMDFRKLDSDGLPDIMLVERSAFTMPWSAAMVRDSLSAAHTEAYGMYNEHDEIIGYVIYSMVLDELELLSMAIRLTCQQQGWGTLLLQQVITNAKQHQAKSIYLEVRRSNKIALSLYKKAGFEIIGERKNYYPIATKDDKSEDKPEDAILLALYL